MGLDWQLLILLISHFQYKKDAFYYLIHYWTDAGARLEFCGMLKATILSSVVLRKHGIFNVSCIRSLDCIDDLLDVW